MSHTLGGWIPAAIRTALSSRKRKRSFPRSKLTFKIGKCSWSKLAITYLVKRSKDHSNRMQRVLDSK